MSSIADLYGFFWDTLWGHERNADLRKKRRDPNVLMAGDQVFIPEKRLKEETGQTGQAHTFRLKGVPVRIKLQLLDEEGNPRAGLKYTLTVDGAKRTGVVPDDGIISEIVPPRAKQARLQLETDEEWALGLGNINPVEYTSGVQARLKNLGYYEGELSGQFDEDTRKALRTFQSDNGLPVTGQSDPDTQTALVAAHGS